MDIKAPEILFSEIPNNSATSIGLITLNRPEALNAINVTMIESLLKQLQLWQDAANIKAVIIEGTNERAFCAGGDIRSLYNAKQQNRVHSNSFFNIEYQLNLLIYLYRKPYISLLNGITMGGGAGLSIHGRWRIATENFIFAMPETGIGFFPDVGAGHFLAHLPFHSAPCH